MPCTSADSSRLRYSVQGNKNNFIIVNVKIFFDFTIIILYFAPKKMSTVFMKIQSSPEPSCIAIVIVNLYFEFIDDNSRKSVL